MKRITEKLLLPILLLCGLQAHAVYVTKMPVAQIQPNGDTVHFFVTGDECYHRYHDANNYTIVQRTDGYWVYAVADAEGNPSPSSCVVSPTSNPAAEGLTPGLTISREEWAKHRRAWEIPPQYRTAQPKTEGRNHGDYCNLVIFIRFADDSSYRRSFNSIDMMFNDSSTSTVPSLYNYFKHASYNKIFMRTYYAPAPTGDTINSYQSPHPRGYYMPYADNNPVGYTNYNQRTDREFELLVGAVEYINTHAPVPTDYVLDCDGDGSIDNVNFIVKGSYTGWSDLLWPHKWNLYGREVYINGKRVNTFNFQLEGSGSNYFGPSTFCHEMFHSLGAPDLYRYNTGTSITPVGSWDLMASNANPPQHSMTYMKYKYGNWIDSIPLITTPGRYTLNSVADSTNANNCYRFPSSAPDQYYVVEYRNTENEFESGIPGKGLIVYRVDTRFNGNAGYNDDDVFDEIWIFRPGSTSRYENGNLGKASFSRDTRRTEFSPSTDPYPFLSDGTRETGFAITNIGSAGNTISFTYSNHPVPADLSTKRLTTASASLSWIGNADAYRVRYRLSGSNSAYKTRLVHSNHATIANLLSDNTYEWSVRGLYGNSINDTYTDSTSWASLKTFHTMLCNNAVVDTIGNSLTQQRTGSIYTSGKNYNYSQQIYKANELVGAMTIGSIFLHYAYTTDLRRENCTILLGNTTIDQFNDSVGPVPGSELTPVFTGTLTLVQGWNEIVLDNQFYYNGTDNLVVAIDDNSGDIARPSEKFYVHNTTEHLTLTYSDTEKNPDPNQDTIQGSRLTMTYRNNIQFAGCPDNRNQVYACIISNNDEWGTVAGEGLYNPNETLRIYATPFQGYEFVEWDDNDRTNPRDVVLTQDTLFVAYFEKITIGIDEAEADKGYLILTSQRRLTVSGAENYPIEVFDLMGRKVAGIGRSHSSEITFTLAHSGIYIVRVGDQQPVKVLVR